MLDCSICMSIQTVIYPSVCLFRQSSTDTYFKIHPTVGLFSHPPICMSIHTVIHRYILYVYSDIYASICKSIQTVIHPSVCIFSHWSMCMSIQTVIHLYVYSDSHPPIYMSIQSSTHMYVYSDSQPPSVCLFKQSFTNTYFNTHPSVCLFGQSSTNIYFCMSVCLFRNLSICMSIQTVIHPYSLFKQIFTNTYFNTHPSVCLFTDTYFNTHPSVCLFTDTYFNTHPSVCLFTDTYFNTHPSVCLLRQSSTNAYFSTHPSILTTVLLIWFVRALEDSIADFLSPDTLAILALELVGTALFTTCKTTPQEW